MIQRYRYEDIFVPIYILDEHLNRCKVPKLILQPFVENAIYHGLRVKPEGGTITIHTKDMGDKMLLEVIDDGIGMDKEKLDELLQKGMSEQGKSFGVMGTIERIRLNYKCENLVAITSEKGKGTRVSITLPKNLL